MMESLPIAPPQIIEGDVVAEDVKRHGKNVVKGRNRQVLGDIGNLVSVRENDPKNQPPLINRPRTRNFNAKLLENGVNAAPVEEKILKAEKQVVKRITKPKKRGESKKQVEIIDISSDSDSDEEQSVLVTKVIAGTKKKTTTYTSVLTARSKAACGLDKKSKKDIVDIDAADANNDLAAVEYVEDIYSFYKSVESEWRPRDYMRSQPEINEKMRTILVEWLIDVNVRFELNPETFYLAINILDRFLSVKTVSRKELQLVGLSALLMSSKYEEI